jgi:CBS domain-containing protein
MIASLAVMDPLAKYNVRMRTLTGEMKKNQEAGTPVHEWPLASISSSSDWIDNYKTVEQFMAVDLFTVRQDDILDLAANLMHWRRVRHVPVEDDAGHLIGLITHRDLLELIALGKISRGVIVVRDVMKTNLITVEPHTPTLKALEMMRDKRIGCLPVVKDNKLVGLITTYDFLTVSAKLFEEKLRAMTEIIPKMEVNDANARDAQ